MARILYDLPAWTYPGILREVSQSAYPEASRSTAALVLGLVSFLFVQALAPLAWVIASRELNGIDHGRRSPSGRRDARLGQVLGIFGTVFLGVGWLLLVAHLVGVVDL